MPTGTKPFDVAEHLDDAETVAAFPSAALATGDQAHTCHTGIRPIRSGLH